MIAITNEGGQRLILTMNQTLTVESSAGWLSDDELPGAKSYPIRFPLSPNEAFLKTGYRPDHARPAMEMIVTVKLEGVLYRRCVLSYRVNEGMGEGYLKIDGGEVFSVLRKLTLQDAIPDVISLDSTQFVPLADRMQVIAGMPPGSFPLTFFPIRNEGFFEAELNAEKLAGFVRQPYVNCWGKLANGLYGFKIDSASVKGYPVSPQFYLTWVLERIFAKANYRIEGDWLADPEVKQLVVLNQTALFISRPPVFPVVSNYWVTAAQHLPFKSVGDFLKAIRQRYGLLFDFDGNRQVVTIRQFKSVVGSPAQDLTEFVVAKAGRARYSIDNPANRGYAVKEGIDSSDELFRDAEGQPITGPAFTIGGAAGAAQQESITLAVGTTQLIDEPSPAATTQTKARWVVPTLRQAGNILDDAYRYTDRYPSLQAGKVSLKNDIDIRLISYRGLVADSKGTRYPLATPDVRNGQQLVIGKLGATLGGRYGIWRRVLRMFYFFRDQTRPLTVPLLMPVSALASLKLFQPIALSLEGGVRRTYLINQLRAESPGASGLMDVRLSALSLPDGLELSADSDEPVVWLELVSTARNAPGPIGGNTLFNARELTTVTVKVWADQAKTQPAVVTNLPVIIRRRKTWIPLNSYVPEKAYEETLATYYVSGSSAVIETDWLTKRAYGNGEDVEIFQILFGLDPGDDYNIIRP